MAIGRTPRIVSLPFFFTDQLCLPQLVRILGPVIQQLTMISQRSEPSALSISITTWSSAHDVRFRKATAISRTRAPSIIGRERRVSHGHRCSIHSSTSACDGCVKGSLKCSCTVSVRPCRRSTFSVFSVSTLSKIGALVRDGGPFKRDGAPKFVASLHQRVACFRLILNLALCAVRWRESSVSQGPFPVCLPGTTCAFRSSYHLVHRDTIYFLQKPISQPSVQLHA